MKPFLLLQLRPETRAADDEYHAFLEKGDLTPDQVHRIRLDRETLPDDLDLSGYCGVIVGGGPGCVSDAPADKSGTEARIEKAVLGLMPQICDGDIPFLGCCYGIGVLGFHLKGDVSKQNYGEDVGTSACAVLPDAQDDPLLAGIPPRFEAFVGHKEAMQSLPPGCTHLVSSPTCPYQMVRFGQNVYATQFHPEADAHDFEQRIRIYKDHGYFPPEQAQDLIDGCHDADVTIPGEILRRFVARFG
jgi:GMP synthase (glutamine-hydrolysing)